MKRGDFEAHDCLQNMIEKIDANDTTRLVLQIMKDKLRNGPSRNEAEI